MDRLEAMRVLGVSEGANAATVEKAFKQRAKKHHPDKAGSTEEMARLNAARDIALTPPHTEMLVPSPQTALVATERALLRQSAREEARESVSRVTRLQVSKLRRYRRLASLFGGIMAAFGAGFEYMRSNELGIFDAGSSSILLTMTFFAGAGYAAVLYYYFTTKADDVEFHISDTASTLSDKSVLLAVLAEILPKKPSAFTREDIEAGVEHWCDGAHARTRGLFPRIRTVQDLGVAAGVHEFTRLVVSKGIETGLLHERQTVVDGWPTVSFAFSAQALDNNPGRAA